MSRNPDKLEYDPSHIATDLAQRIRASGHTIREIASRSGLAKSRVHEISRAKARVTVEDVQRLGFALGFDPACLLQLGPKFEITSNPTQEHLSRVIASVFEASFAMSRELGQGAGVTEVLRWHESTGGRLENYDRLRPFVGLYEIGTDGQISLEAREIGHHCLAATSLHASGPEQVNSYIRSIATAAREEIVFSYAETLSAQRYQLYKRDLTVDFPGAGPRYRLKYATLLLPVLTPSGEKFVMNFSVYLTSEVFGDQSSQSTRNSGASASS